MRLLRTLAPAACVLAVAVSQADRIAAVSSETARTVLHRSVGKDNVFCRLYLDPHDTFTSVGPPPHVAALRVSGAVEAAANANITVNYTGFDGANGPAAQAAFQAAVDIWKTQISSGVPIVIDAEFKDLCNGVAGCGLLGQAGSSAISDVPDAPQPHVYYPYPLLNKMAGIDVGVKTFPGSPNESNIFAEFNNNGINWYFGTDGQPPTETVDFESVVLHELGHGLGFVGFANVTGSTGTIGSSGIPYIYDTFVSDSSVRRSSPDMRMVPRRLGRC